MQQWQQGVLVLLQGLAAVVQQHFNASKHAFDCLEQAVQQQVVA
jgi:hypothetical protein